MTKIKGPQDAASVGFGGKEYPVKKGIAEVPDEAVQELAKHGWKPLQEEDKP